MTEPLGGTHPARGGAAGLPAGGRASTGGSFGLRMLVAVCAVVVVAVVVGLFALGLRVGESANGEAPDVAATVTPTATPSPTPTASPSATPEPTAASGPAAPGVHPWTDLAGGECLTGYSSPWAAEFTVVDCAEPHTAQLVTKGVFAEDGSAAYPGEPELVSRLNLLCTAPAALDYAAAGAVPDVQWQASYPAAETEWAAGDRAYSCFFSRSSGEPLAGTLRPAA